jgi:hypothetical protein
VILVHKGHKVNRVILANREILAQLVLKVNKVLLVQKARREKV